jgi:hypothetical protein
MPKLASITSEHLVSYIKLDERYSLPCATVNTFRLKKSRQPDAAKDGALFLLNSARERFKRS